MSEENKLYCHRCYDGLLIWDGKDYVCDKCSLIISGEEEE